MATTPNTPAPPAEETPGDIVVIDSKALEQAKADLASLTEQAREGLSQFESGFVKAARAVSRIRDEKLVEAVFGPEKSFADYCAENFSISRDVGDKYARAGLIYDRIVADLGTEAENLALPVGEYQLRPMGKLLKSDPKKKLFGKVWKESIVKAEKKGGFVAKPTAEDVREAISSKAKDFAVSGSGAGGKGRSTTPAKREVYLAEDASDLDKAVAALIQSYDDVPVGTLRSIIVDAIKLASKHSVNASAVEQTINAVTTAPVAPEVEEAA